nr:hypothetical protein [uncultured Flavobacterium sp.]
MKKILLILVYLLVTSCVTNYYFVNIEEDTPIFKNSNGGGESITTIPKGYGAYITKSEKKQKRIKWKNYKGWAINPIYSIPNNSSSYSGNTNRQSTNYYNSSTNSSSGKTVHVKGYTRKDGTYVRPHTRSAPKRR